VLRGYIRNDWSFHDYSRLSQSRNIKLVRHSDIWVSSTGLRLNGRFQLSAPESYSTKQREKLLLNWFREMSLKIFKERFPECTKVSAVIGITKEPVWKVKIMTRRWGSCTKEGNIYLNPKLVTAPKVCIDYVIFHELCHTKEHNHSSRFYALLSRVYPDWKKWRDYLNENIEVRIV